jgi:hypothetical protein
MKEGASGEQRDNAGADCSGFHAILLILPQCATSSPPRV